MHSSCVDEILRVSLNRIFPEKLHFSSTLDPRVQVTKRAPFEDYCLFMTLPSHVLSGQSMSVTSPTCTKPLDGEGS